MANNQGKIATDQDGKDSTLNSTELALSVVTDAAAVPPAATPAVTPKPASPKMQATTTEAQDAPKMKAVPKARPTSKPAPQPKTSKPKTPKPKIGSLQPPLLNAAALRTYAASPSKGQLNMNDMLTKFAEQAKANAEAFAAQFGERAKDAFAKSGKLAEETAAFNKSNVEALVESGKVAAKNMEMLRDESLSYVRKSFEDGSLAMKSLTNVTSPAEFFKLYAENNRKALDHAVAQASKNSEMLVKMSSEAFAPLSNRMSVISSQMKVQ